MRNINKLYMPVITGLFIFLAGCGQEESNLDRTVHVREENGKYVLYRNGKPYYIKGAGGYQNFEKLKEYGGNSIRLWDTYKAKKILDEAHELGLTVTLGLNVARERHGFDYDDEEAVRKQFLEMKKIVETYKDHPALLMWAVGNEVDQLGSNMKVWDAVNDIAAMIHEVDPEHPTTTMIVPSREKILRLKWSCPEIDILSVNTFEELPELPSKLNEWVFGWDGPYIVSEWGSTGWWESERTSWDVAIEEPSHVKAEKYRKSYEIIKNDEDKCIGSYAFFWGMKQERTPTWFSLFLYDGKETEAVGVLKQLWSNTKESNKAPRIIEFTIDGKKATDNNYLKAGKKYEAIAKAFDPEADSLIYFWEVLAESTDLNGGGDFEERPPSFPDLVEQPVTEINRIHFTAPAERGPYRIYVYAYDKHNMVGTANIPFYVTR